MPLISCPECKKEVSDKANVCNGCGYPLNKRIILVCPECGKEISDNTIKCSGCGYPISRQNKVRLDTSSIAHEMPELERRIQKNEFERKQLENGKLIRKIRWSEYNWQTPVVVLVLLFAVFALLYLNQYETVIINKTPSDDVRRLILTYDKLSKDYPKITYGMIDVNGDGLKDIVYTNNGMLGSCGISYSVLIVSGDGNYKLVDDYLNCIGESITLTKQIHNGFRERVDYSDSHISVKWRRLLGQMYD